MPLPSPNKDEEQKSFVSRCIGTDSVVEEFPDQKQRVAICFSQWRQSKKKDSATTDDDVERSFVFNLDYSKESKFRIDETTGFLHAKARLTRAGVFDYYDDEGNLFREYRPDEEVFDDKSMKSLELKPITNDHPNQLVTVDNIKSLQVGTIGEKIEKDDIYLLSNIVITDKDMVNTVVNRKKSGLATELSCGYSCNLISDLGIHEKDGYYTIKQQHIRYNHVGIVDKARAGHNVKILDKLHNNKKKETNKMADKVQFSRKAIDLGIFKIDSIVGVMDEDSLKLINVVSDKLDEATLIIKTVQDEKEALQGKFDQANETINTLKKDIETLSDVNSPRIIEMIKIRNDVENIAAALEIKCEGKDLKTIKCDCIKKASENANLEGKEDAYINARFDSIAEIIVEKKKNDGNSKFYQFMKNVTDGKDIDDDKNHRTNFIKKDKEQNRK